MRGRRHDTNAYQEATALARELRGNVADQLCELVKEGDRMGSRGELADRIRTVIEIERRIDEARGRQRQAREMGLPLRPAFDAEREAKGLLRAAVISLGVASGTWVAAMDFEAHGSPERSAETAEAASEF